MLAVEVSIEVVGEEGEIGLQKEVVEEDHIWRIGAIATHAVDLKRVDGGGNAMKETAWSAWIVMLTQIPDTTTEETNAGTLEIVNCSGTKWKLAPTRATIQDSLVKRYRRRLLLRHLLPLLDLRLVD